MKVLWFANTPCSAAEKLQLEGHRGGWLKSLENELNKTGKVDLYIAFYFPQIVQPFKYNDTTYIPVFRKSISNAANKIIGRVFNNMNGQDRNELPALLEVIKKVSPDIIHIHGTEENFGLINSHTTIPVVISIQGLLAPYSEKYYSGIPESVAKKHEKIGQKIQFKSIHKLYKNLVNRSVREVKILSNAQYIIGRTNWDYHVTRLMAPNSTYFINNEILRSDFYNIKWSSQSPSNTIRIVTVLSGAIYKGFETIVKTIQLLASNQHFHYQWTVIGLRENHPMAQIVKRWLKVNYRTSPLRLVGIKNEKEIIDELVSSDIYCQVSHIENSPNSLCEAMLIGMPVIASYAGGTSSLLEDGKEGILVQDGDPYALAGAIIELGTNRENAVKLAQSAQNRAKSRHCKQTITNDLISIYQQVKEVNYTV